jgi:hypothetical protein
VSTEPTADDLAPLLARVPEGWTRFEIDGRPWAVSRVPRADGRAVTLEAEQLGGAVRFGANVWLTSSGPVLRPCEVPPERVLGLLRSLPECLGTACSDWRGADVRPT